MELSEFIEGERARLLRFKVWYEKQHERKPEYYPLEMELGDWVEQYEMWEDDK